MTEKENVVETADQTIDLDEVIAFENAEGSKKPKLQVYLQDGSVASVEGAEKVQEYVEAIDEHHRNRRQVAPPNLWPH